MLSHYICFLTAEKDRMPCCLMFIQLFLSYPKHKIALFIYFVSHILLLNSKFSLTTLKHVKEKDNMEYM